ncbi:MAG: hypothetical protein ABIP97_09665 [Chthoniobacterales bacterium]
MKTTPLIALAISAVVFMSGCFSYKTVDREPRSSTTTVQHTRTTPTTTTTVTR